MAKMTGLGRGLGSLIPNKTVAKEAITPEKESLLVSDDHDKILQVKVSDIDTNPHQPRSVFDHDELAALVNSIREHGIMQPLVVSKSGGGYELIAGERRLRAAKIADLKKVPVIVRDATEQQKLELALIENIQRQQLNPVEEAVAYQKLIDEFSLTQEEVSERVGKSRSVIANSVRLLSLPEAVQKALVDKKITEGHARVIAGMESEAEQLKFLDQILTYNFTVRDAERESRKLMKKKPLRRSLSDPRIEAVKEDLRGALGTKVDIKKNGPKGQILINFYSDEEFQEVVDRITS